MGKTHEELRKEHERAMFDLVYLGKSNFSKNIEGDSSLASSVDFYNSDMELNQKNGVDFGHNLADAIMKIYGPRIYSAHGNLTEENKIRMEINKLGKKPKNVSAEDYHLKNMFSRVNKNISQNN